MCNNESWVGREAQTAYEQLLVQMEALLAPEIDWLANLANATALLYHALPDLNWAGFYLHKQGELILGPFQGKPACVRIAIGKGVCGTASERRETVVVQDVHLFPGHIVCDLASRSEIVVPIIQDERVWGVLDLDSPCKGRFSRLDQTYLERLVELLYEHVEWRAACGKI